MGRYRTLRGFYQGTLYFFTSLAILFSIYQIFNFHIKGIIFFDFGYLAALAGFFLPLVFFLFPATAKSPRYKVPWYDTLLAILSLTGPTYVFIFANDITLLGWEADPPLISIPFAVVTWILIIETVRRTTGGVLAIFVSFCTVYPLIARYLPGMFAANVFSIKDIVGFYFLGHMGIWGLPLDVLGNLFFGYLLFGIIVQSTGGGKFFTELALSIFGTVRGGPAKVAIVSSSLFGMLSGSAVSNVVTTGTITIPAMKKCGYPPYYAAAIEAVASTGGVITPPVMGAVAFLMAQFINVSYWEVCLFAFIPALLYYVSVYIQSDMMAAKIKLQGIPKEEKPNLIKTIKWGWFYFTAIFVLIYFLLFLRVENQAPYYVSIFLLLCGFLAKQVRPNLNLLTQILEGSAKVCCEVTPILCGIGIVIGALTLTGLAHGISSELIKIAGGNLIVLLFLTAAASFILGMGVSVTACYIFLAMVIAPALIGMGISLPQAHMFILYWGCASYITPPVALSAIAAAAIAGTSSWKTGWQAVRLGIVMLIVPFMFVFNPALIGMGGIQNILWSVFIAIAAIIFISSAFEGYFYFIGNIHWSARLLFGISGFLLMFPSQGMIFGGIAIGVANFVIIRGFLKRRV